MRLMTALRMQPGEVVALVGGGGKTTSMFRLASEIRAAGWPVVTTTTTQIFAAQIALGPKHLVAGRNSLEDIAAALEETGHVLVTGSVERGSGKAPGVPVAWIPNLQSLPGRPTILIEADGSRMRPFKAPAEHEPVIPPEATLVVPVVGADVFEAALEAQRVHRPEVVAALAGVPLGAAVTPEVVAAVLAHPQGGLKSAPPAARVIPFINKVETQAQQTMAEETARLLLEHDRILAVAQGAAQRESPAALTWGRVAAVVLAAGQSTRMGAPKQLLPWREHDILGTVVRTLQASPVETVVVVTGRDRAAVEASVAAARLPGRPAVACVYNRGFAEGDMARSLQEGLAALPENCLAAIVALADQPQLQPDTVTRLIERWRATQTKVVAPFYQGQRGHPLLFDRAVWPQILSLPAQARPRQLVEALGEVEVVAVDSDSILRDVDTPEDYAAEMARQGARG